MDNCFLIILNKFQPYIPLSKRPIPPIDSNISDIARMIIEDYARWQVSLGDFLTQEPQRVNVSPNQIRNVLEITGMINKRKSKSPRYRGSTTKLQPGTMLVTEGKEIKVHLISSRKHAVTIGRVLWIRPLAVIPPSC